jgi:hypothetical protein
MDPYAVLGVTKDFSPDVIKARYLQLVKQYHPDTNKGSKYSEEKLKQINIAYDLIRNGTLKAKIDPPPKPKDELKEYTVKLSLIDNFLGFRILLPYGYEYIAAGWSNSVGTMCSGNKLKTTLILPEPFVLRNDFDVEATVIIEKRFAKKGRLVELPWISKYGYVCTKDFTIPRNFTDKLSWQFTGQGIVRGITRKRTNLIIHFKTKPNKNIFARLFE